MIERVILATHKRRICTGADSKVWIRISNDWGREPPGFR